MSSIRGTQLTQFEATITIDHPLGDPDLLNMRRMKVHEGIDELFVIEAHVASPSPDISFDSIVGKEVTFAIKLQDGDRYFHGIVGHFMQYATSDPNANEVTWYELKVYPKLWLLTLSSDCRIFQNEKPLDIIKTVLTEHGVTDVLFQTTTCGQVIREYCVQYNETHFEFVCRLMEEEGVFYFFKHEQGKHTLILADAPTAFQPCVGSEQLSYTDSSPDKAFLNTLYQCDFSERVASLSHAANDYNMKTASMKLYSMDMAGPVQETLKGDLYEYPGQVDHEDIPAQGRLEALIKLRLEEAQALQKYITGESIAPYLTNGGSFLLAKHHRADMMGKKYVIHRITHEVQSGVEPDLHEDRDIRERSYLYRNSFKAFEDSVIYRPPRKTPRPKIESIQSAIVTGPVGEEIWTDEYGRIKVQFKWDRQWPNDDTSSCWIRVQQGWGGNNWGVLFTPRIGMEVMVNFLDGDPSRPVVTGSLYNSDNRPPYLPERVTGEFTPTKSGFKTKSSIFPAGPEKFNEHRFEDKTGEEQVYKRAEKDDDSYTIETETKHIEKGSKWLVLDHGDRNVLLKGGGSAVPKTTPKGQDLPAGAGDDILELSTGSRYTSFMSGNGPIRDTTYIKEGLTEYQHDKGTMSRVFKEGNDRKTIIKGNREVVLKEGNDFHKIIKGNRHTVIATGDNTHEIITGDDKTYIHTGNHLMCIETGNKKLKIDLGNKGTLIDQGNEVTRLKKGNQRLMIDLGNRIITLQSGNSTLTLEAGNQTEDVTGHYYGTYTETYNLTVTGNINIVGKDNINVTAANDINVKSGANINVTAASNISVKAGGDISMTAGGKITATSGSSTSVTAGSSISTTSGSSTSVTAGSSITGTAGSSVSLTSGGATSVTAGGSISLTSGGSHTITSGGSMTVTASATTFTVSSFTVIT